MAEQDQSEEKTEEPTAKRIEKAREDGQIARSQELSVAAMMIGVESFMYLFGAGVVTNISNVFRTGFIFDRKDIFSDNLLPAVFGTHGLESMLAILPIFTLALIIAVGAAGLIGGFNFSFKAFAPKASKLNPLSGFKRMFGLQAIVNLAKAIAKFSLVGGVLFLVINNDFNELIGLGSMNIETGLASAGSIIARGAVFVTLALIIVAAIDVPYQVFEHNKKLKMTKKEVKDELKETEGRPEVKQHIRKKQRELAMNAMIDAVADSDVVIVNPEHFAVALSYDPASSGAPVMVAKGVDFLAEKIRDKAKLNGVPIFEAPPLARAIYFTTDVNQSIPEALYYAVAQVIAYVFNLNSLNKGATLSKKPVPEVPDNMNFSMTGTLIASEKEK